MNRYLRYLTLNVLLALSFLVGADEVAGGASSDSNVAPIDVSMTYRRLLPLEGGSNFRDLGGYPAADGRQIKRGLLFRSGAMTGLTANDEGYLSQFAFKSVIDLRSDEELDLYPNHWAKRGNLNYIHRSYSIMDMMKEVASHKAEQPSEAPAMYLHMMEFLEPQLSLYFDTLLRGEVPAVVNCSAGQDRTGVTSALLLSALGVERELIIEDYLLSTDFRRPRNEKGDVDLAAAAETNAFAAMMLEYGQDEDDALPSPLVTEDGTPFIVLTLTAIEQRHGSVARYLENELGIDPQKLARLRSLYLQ